MGGQTELGEHRWGSQLERMSWEEPPEQIQAQQQLEQRTVQDFVQE